MTNFKEAVKQLKSLGWKKARNYENVIVMEKNKKSLLIEKRILDDKVGFMLTEHNDYNEVIDHGELQNNTDIIDLDLKYGEQA